MEPDRQSEKTDLVIKSRALRLLSRVLPRAASRTTERPPARPVTTWAEELVESGHSAADWIDRRIARDAIYVNVNGDTIEALRRRHPDIVSSTVAAAARILRHEFDLLGSGPYTPRDPERAASNGYAPIDWYLDPVAGLRFPRAIPLADWNFDAMRPGNADIKFPWELARCQHFPVLGQAFALTADERYARELARQLGDFLDANPIGTAVNWACTMDVGLRAANWALGLELVRSCPGLPPEFWHRAYEALFAHGTFIETHLENTYEVTSNHFLSNVVGLFFVAAVFDDLPRGRAWDTQCRTWLVEEMQVQVLPDGADYESSVPYHRLVSELFLGAARLAEYKHAPLPVEFMQRLRAMFEFLEAIVRPDGLLPQVGDADDGRLHILTGYGDWKPQDARHLFGPAGSLFDDASWRGVGGAPGQWESAWWGFENDLEPSTPRCPRALRHFPRAGLTVMRRDLDYLIVTNGVVGTGGFGNHKHNDQLAFEFHAGGKPMIVDPGSYVYTSDADARNLFRSTVSHNTVGVDGEEQNELRPESLFRMFEKATPEHLEVGERDDLLVYRGRHHGYTRLAEHIVHERGFAFSRRDGSLTIDDRLGGRGTHRLRWHFHFAPGVEVTAAEAGRFSIRDGDLSLTLTAPPALAVVIARGWYSPSYGVRIPCLTLDLETEAQFDGLRRYQFRIAP
jgi:hypothetical protein